MHQDFSGQNLRGRSFRGQNLEGANFSCTDIRGANFTGANLQGANFSNVKAGLQKRWVIVLVGVSCLLAGISGFFLAFVGFLLLLIFDSKLPSLVFGWVTVIVVITLITIIIVQGINIVFTVIFAITGAITFAFARDDFNFAVAFAIVAAFAIIGAFTIVGAITRGIAFSVTFAGVGAIIGAICLAITGGGVLAFAGAIAGAVVFFLLSIYIVRQAMKGSEKYTILRSTAIVLASFAGTSFRNANLTDTNLSGAILVHTDFRQACLIRTCFQETKKLDLVRPGSTYLKKLKVVKVLVTKHGQDLNFDCQDLQGVNFKGAYLQDASFIGANLSGANLSYGDFSRAKLVQTQLDGADFTGATLTGAYIENWNITNSTNLTSLRCEYVYTHLPTIDNLDPHRKPDNQQKIFAPGEFEDFIQLYS